MQVPEAEKGHQVPCKLTVEQQQQWLHFYTHCQTVDEGISTEAPAKLEEAVTGIIMTAHGTGK